MEALRQVSTDIPHDLRTPSTRLFQHLKRMQVDGNGAAESVGQALEEASGLQATFTALLSVGSVEAGIGQRALRRSTYRNC